MLFRASVVLCFLLPLVLADEVDIKMNSVKADKKKPGSFRFQGMCVYDMDDDVEAEGVTFSVQFDRPTQGFKAKGAKVVATDGNSYNMTNAKPIRKDTYVVFFSANFNMTEDSCVLSGVCTELEESDEA